jgi:hypothetical protein
MPVEVVAVSGAVEIVHVNEVDAIETQPLAAVVEGALDTLARVIVFLDERRNVDVPVLRRRRARIGMQDAADLGRQHERIAAGIAQRHPEPALGQAMSVVRRRVEIADAEGPCTVHDRDCFVVGKCAIQVAERRATERDARQRRSLP